MQRLIDAIFGTITEVENWGAVIKSLLGLTGAAKGILALRANQTADFRVPSRVLESPLIINFDQCFVESFVAYYVNCDPWTTIEVKHPPVRPYALSEYLPVECLRTLEFWSWLEPQGISDTIVVLIGETEGHWVGMNIFFDASDDAVRDAVFDVLGETLPIMRHAWRIGELHRLSANSTYGRSGGVAQIPLTAVFCNRDGTINAATEQFRQISGDLWGLFQSIESTVRFSLAAHQSAFVSLLEHAARTGSTVVDVIHHGDRTITISVSPVTAEEDIIGRYSEEYLVVLSDPVFDGRRRLESLNLRERLTHRERELLDYLRDPAATIASFSAGIGRSKHTSDYHWRNLKKKLGIRSISELRELMRSD